MGWIEDQLAAQQGLADRERAISADNNSSYIGGFIGSTLSSVGEMFGMEPTVGAEQFRREYPGSGLASEITGSILPYVGWESVLARAPRLATTLGGAATKLGINPLTQPIRAGAVNLAVRYSPVELSRLGTGLFITDDWDKYTGLMADVGLSTMLAGGIGGLGGYLKSTGKAAPSLIGRTKQAPQGLADFAELRIIQDGNATPANPAETIEMVKQARVRGSFTERPITGEKAVHALKENSEPRAVFGLNRWIFKENNSPKGLLRQKLMQDDGTWTLGDLGNKELLAGLGHKRWTMDDLAAMGRYSTVVTPGSDRAAGTLRKTLEALSPVGDGAFMGQEAGDGLWVVGIRTKVGDAAKKSLKAKAALEKQIAELDALIASPKSKGMVTSLKAGQRKLYGQLKKMQPLSAVNAGDQWFFIKTDRPDMFVKGVSKSTRATVNAFAKYRDAFRPEVNQETFFNQAQNMVIRTFTPEDLTLIYKGQPEKARANWFRRVTEKGGEFTGLKDSEMLNRIWNAAYHTIGTPMGKGMRNSLYDRTLYMLQLSKTQGEGLINRMVGGTVKATRRPRGFGPHYVHAPEVAPGIKTLNQLAADHVKNFTEADWDLYRAVAGTQTPKELLSELTANGQVSEHSRLFFEGIEKLDKYFWNEMLPVAKALGLETKFSLVDGPYISGMMKGDWYVPVTADAEGKALKFLASGTKLQAQHHAEEFVKVAKEKGLTYHLQKPVSWYTAGDDVYRIEKTAQAQLVADSTIKDISRAAMRNIAIQNAGLRPGMMRPGPLPKTLSETRSGLEAAYRGSDNTAKQLIADFQQHYNTIARYLGHENWKQRWLPEVTRLHDIDPRMAEDVLTRGLQMVGYQGKTAEILNAKLAPFFGGSAIASKIAHDTNKLMYHWNIGLFNPVFAIVNLLTPLQTVAPWMAMMKTAPQNADDLMHTTFRFGADGKPQGIWNTLDIPKLMGRSLRELGRPDDDLLAAMGRWATEGGRSPQMFENFAGHGSEATVGIREAFKRAGGGAYGVWEAMKNIATFASTRSEMWSREYAFTAAWVLGRDVKGLTGETLYQFAKRGTHVTMYGYHAMDRSMLFTGPLGSMFGLFKNWQMHFITSMFEYAGLGWKEGIWAPLIWQFAGSLAVGGLGATPLVLVADRITDWMDNQPNSYLWMKENWGGPDITDEIYYGFPAMFGLSLQASSALPGTDVRNDLTMLSNFVFWERAKAAFKATKGAWDYAEQNGQNPLTNPNVTDALLQGFAPRALWRLFSTTEGDAIKSMSSGYPQIRDVSPIGQLAYQLGFNPVEIERQQDAARYLWRDQTAQREAIAQHGIRLANAELNGDPDEILRTVEHGISLGLPMQSVAKSAQSRMRREHQHDLLTKYGYQGAYTRYILGEE